MVGRSLLLSADKQGTPVKLRDGPAAVTKVNSQHSYWSLSLSGDEKAAERAWKSEDLPPQTRLALSEGEVACRTIFLDLLSFAAPASYTYDCAR